MVEARRQGIRMNLYLRNLLAAPLTSPAVPLSDVRQRHILDVHIPKATVPAISSLPPTLGGPVIALSDLVGVVLSPVASPVRMRSASRYSGRIRNAFMSACLAKRRQDSHHFFGRLELCSEAPQPAQTESGTKRPHQSNLDQMSLYPPIPDVFALTTHKYGGLAGVQRRPHIKKSAENNALTRAFVAVNGVYHRLECRLFRPFRWVLRLWCNLHSVLRFDRRECEVRSV